MTDHQDVEARLACYIAEALAHAPPKEAMERARRHFLDTLAAILSGRSLAAGRFAYAFVAAGPGAPEATLLGSDDRAGLELAAFANAMAAHADETDDSHARGRFHPGCGVIPAAFAVAEHVGASADELLKAIALGYDVGARSTMALGYTSPKTTVFSTHAFGALFGAAAAAGALMRLSAREAGALLSFTAQQVSGLAYWNRDPDHIEKSFDFGGRAARNGVFAAQLAKRGMTAPDRPLTGPRGYLEAFAETPNAGALVDGLGERFEIEFATIKKWSVGSPLQSMLDALEALFKGRPVAAEAIDAVEVQLPSNRIHIVDDKSMPAVCAQHLVALTLLRGRPTFALTHDVELMRDPQILALREKVRLIADDALAKARPERQSVVTVRMRDAEIKRHHAMVVRGTPDDPMTAAEVAAKAQDILSPILSDGGRRLIDLCLEAPFTTPQIASACRVQV